MTGTTDALLLDLVEWLAARPQPYGEVMEAWRTSCPRLTIWEDAVDRGLVISEPVTGGGTIVKATPQGREFLRDRRQLPAPT